MLNIKFEFIGGPNDGKVVEGKLGEPCDAERHFLLSNRGLVGQRFAVDSAAGATEALQLLEDHEFDVVITDNKMPTRSGLWLLKQLRERRPTIRRVMMSGTTVGDLHSHMKQGLVQVFLAKPFESERLLACVEVPESGHAPDLDAPDTTTGGDYARPGTTHLDPRR